MSVSQQSNHSATSNRWLPLQGQQRSQCNVIFTLYGASSLHVAASYSHHYVVQLYMHTTRLDVACTLNTVPCSVTFTLCITVQSLVLQSLSEELCIILHTAWFWIVCIVANTLWIEISSSSALGRARALVGCGWRHFRATSLISPPLPPTPTSSLPIAHQS